ncbi:chitin-binding protein [Thermocatellispora tengchongensis]|uniref:Chitin-binding protein n=1 Tax=Thermocatellispora tengchongensis TaxID=1073253 RepID=A0A840P6W6_9ACTN|nr:lytic polysaccharide monooxygenase [Thermocatellispora tengchongensis]MBB5135062.1 chitin-binding protein [Thermocatellispora tengchongensis]
MEITSTARRKALVIAALAAPSLLLPAFSGQAYAHGTMNNPPSRALVCYNENPESPDSAACKQAVALGGTQPLYDWNEVNIADAAGRHRQIIPDGELCSAGRDKYRGLDQARADWPATTLRSGASFTFTYRATAPHRGSFELYVTKNGYDPTAPLKWSDLESTPFAKVTDPALSGGAYTIDARLPSGKQGRHLIYAIWQRSDSPEAFYSCSDVVFTGSSGGTAPTQAPTRPAATPTPPVTPPVTAPPTTAPTHDHEHPLPSPTPTRGGDGDGPLAQVAAGVGVHPAKAARGQSVTVTAVCSSGRVVSVASGAFTRRTTAAGARAETWYPTLTVSASARPGTHAVYVRCAGGGLARTALTVTG